jgi:sec-independent protein translocase protein TatA
MKGETMFTQFGVPELLIVLAIVVLLFGVGRIGKIAGELGNSIRSFRDGLKGEEKTEQEK